MPLPIPLPPPFPLLPGNTDPNKTLRLWDGCCIFSGVNSVMGIASPCVSKYPDSSTVGIDATVVDETRDGLERSYDVGILLSSADRSICNGNVKENEDVLIATGIELAILALTGTSGDSPS